MEKTRDKDSQRRERGCDSNIMVDYIMGINSESYMRAMFEESINSETPG